MPIQEDFSVFPLCKEEKLAMEYKKLYKIVTLKHNFFKNLVGFMVGKLAPYQHWGRKELDQTGVGCDPPALPLLHLSANVHGLPCGDKI